MPRPTLTQVRRTATLYSDRDPERAFAELDVLVRQGNHTRQSLDQVMWRAPKWVPQTATPYPDRDPEPVFPEQNPVA
jgi:hypothetical protein